MRIINVPTKRGLVLRSVMYEAQSADTIMILMTGICSNIFNNQLLQSTGELLRKNGISYIVGQAIDAFSVLHFSNTVTKAQELKGVALDDFSVINEDIQAYIDYAKSLGYKNIILGGHSLGSNRIIHYLSQNPDSAVKQFVISGPVDFADMLNVMTKPEQFEIAQKLVNEGRGEEILPFLFGGFSPMSANTMINNWYNNKIYKNCPFISGDGETNSLSKIKIKGLILIGEKDSCAGSNPFEFASKINNCMQQDNTIVILEGAGHIFYNKHNEYAQTVLEFIKKEINYGKECISNIVNT